MKLLICLSLSLLVSRTWAFCGFYVAKADSSLYNKASQVVLVRNENKTALTMFSDYQGELKDFALVIPVPEVLSREQINVAERSIIDRVDAFSAPRLVEYFDSDPCAPAMLYKARGMSDGSAMLEKGALSSSKSLGVTIEARYLIGEYDILILGAKESAGLEKWLTNNGYKLPKGASKALEPYIKQNLKFFVAKVNLEEQVKTGFKFLRPIQFAYESPKFMLPIRLGMVNSDGPQDMLIYAITKKGRVETTNYRTVKLPTDMDIPLYVKSKFSDFYRAMFEVAHNKENKKVVFLEYAWNMGWCDPCAADPLTDEELRKLGVFWTAASFNPKFPKVRPGVVPPMQPQPEAYITRLHVKYDAEHFPEDLFFQETGDSENFQGRYVLRHPWMKEIKCEEAKTYQKELASRRRKEAENLAKLTQWKMEEIEKEMGKENVSTPNPTEKSSAKWYQNIFK
ncbi:MAG: DUF2330 domain-containing protein [Deltaproteobacteria bacterium]|nr:DUF2330 domain-containing protein [Deltaproteobacteria bacterium]